MANEIEIYIGETGETSRIDFHKDLSKIPGHYFRTLHDIPAREETSKEEARRFSFEKGVADEFGQVSVTYNARRSVQGGLTLLAVKLRFLDEVLHSVVMAPHPTEVHGSNLVFMADEFFTYFVADEDGEQVRSREIAEVSARIQDIQQKLMAPPPSAPDLIAPPTLQMPSTSQLVAAVRHKENLEERAKALAVRAEDHQKFLQAGTAEIMENTKLLTRFYQEKATGALALVGDQIKYAKDLMEGLTTLSLYTGEEVDVETLVEGEHADASEPLTLYQDLLYLDEELATESIVGGFDFTKLNSLGEMLSRDARLIDRMVPAKRGAVLVQVRASSKLYFSDPAMAMADAMMNMKNKERFLLVRDGDNVHLVFSEITSNLASKLFPTRKEIDDLFKSSGREVRPEHLNYANAKDEFEKKTVFYKRMILMLWGLNDRLNLFGEFYDINVFNNWYDGDFQSQRLVYIYDGEGTLEMQRPNFVEWLEKQNSNLQVGSRMMVAWHRVVHSESAAPGCFKYINRSGDREQSHSPVESFGLANVLRDGERLVIKTEVKKLYARSESKSKPFMAKIDLVEGLRDTTAGICIDDISVEELDYYLNSRKQRRNYASYFELFKKLRELLTQEEEAQASTLLKLAGDLSYAIKDELKATEAIRKAVSLWRTQHNARLLGGAGWSTSDHELVLSIAYALAGGQNDLIDRASADIEDCSPIEVRIDGNGTFWLYREPTEEEKSHPSSVIGVAHAVRVRLRVGKTKVSTIGEAKRAYIANPPFNAREQKAHPTAFIPVREVTVATNASVKEHWEGKKIAGWESFENMQVFMRAASVDANQTLASYDVDKLSSTVLKTIRHHSKGQVASISFIQPVAVVSSCQRENEGLYLLVMTSNALEALASFEEQGGFGLACGIIKRMYKTPEDRLMRLRSELDKAIMGYPPFTFSLLPLEGVRILMKEGNVLNYEQTNIYLNKTWFDHKSRETLPVTSIEESIRMSLSRYDNGDDLVQIHWVEKANEKFARDLFDASLSKRFEK